MLPPLHGNLGLSAASSIGTFTARPAAPSTVEVIRPKTICLPSMPKRSSAMPTLRTSLSKRWSPMSAGHQLLARHPRLAKRVVGVSEASEEILASLLGAMLCNSDVDRVTLFAKATAELLDRGVSAESANRQLQDLWDMLEALL